MTVSAPPRPPSPQRTAPGRKPLEREETEALVEALIEEARRETRRRYRKYWAVAALTAFVGVATFTALGRTAQSQTASPALSAGTNLAAAARGSKIAFVSEPLLYGYCGIVYVMNADGSGRHRLSQSAAVTCGQEYYPTWSPDGRKILFASYGIHVMNADFSERRRLTRSDAWGAAPAWSPDGRAIAFARLAQGTPCNRPDCFDRSSKVEVINADGSKLRTLTRDAAGDGNVAWSPDRRKIAFVSRRDTNLEIYVMDADGSRQRRLTHNTVDDSDPVWSPDGQRIAFVSNGQVHVMNLDSSGQRRLTRNGAHNFAPAWSPDGQKIAFERRLGKRLDAPCHTCGWAARYEVHVINADGSEPRRLTRSGMQPIWAPDGKHIAFVNERDGETDIYLMKADGSEQRNLTRTKNRLESSPAWSAGQAK